MRVVFQTPSHKLAYYYLFFDKFYLCIVFYVVGIIFDVRRQRGLYVVWVGLDVVVLQDLLQASALLLPALLGTRHCGR